MKQKLVERVHELATAFRLWLPTAPQQIRLFIASAKEDPGAILRSPAARITGLIVGGIFLLIIGSCVARWISPRGPMGSPAELASYHVQCLNPKCKFSGTVRLKPRFKKWPTECPKCKERTLYPYMLCYNNKCRKWVVPKVQPDGSLRCPACGAPL
jgi:hypothetical protein